MSVFNFTSSSLNERDIPLYFVLISGLKAGMPYFSINSCPSIAFLCSSKRLYVESRYSASSPFFSWKAVCRFPSIKSSCILLISCPPGRLHTFFAIISASSGLLVSPAETFCITYPRRYSIKNICSSTFFSCFTLEICSCFLSIFSLSFSMEFSRKPISEAALSRSPGISPRRFTHVSRRSLISL